MQHSITSSSDSIVVISFQCNDTLEFLRSFVIVFPGVPVFFRIFLQYLSFSQLCGEIFKLLKVLTLELVSHGFRIFHILTKCSMELFHPFFKYSSCLKHISSIFRMFQTIYKSEIFEILHVEIGGGGWLYALFWRFFHRIFKNFRD